MHKKIMKNKISSNSSYKTYNGEYVYITCSIHDDIMTKITKDFDGKSLYQCFKNQINSLKDIEKSKPFLTQKYAYSYQILKGFQAMQKIRMLRPIKESDLRDIYIYEFYNFIIKFYDILKNIDKDLREKLIKRFESHLNINNIFLPFKHEIEIFIYLSKKLGFKIIDFPDLHSNEYTFDALIEKDSLQFEIECKSLYSYSGHPIILDAAEKFSLLINEEIINDIINKFCIIEFSFEGRLLTGGGNSDDYTPEHLARKFNEDIRNKSESIKILNTNEIDKLDGRSILIYKTTKPECLIKLRTTANNDFIKNIHEQINKSFKQFTGKKPAVIYLYLDGLPSNFSKNERVINSLQRIIKNACLNYRNPLLVICMTELDREESNSTDTYIHCNNAFEEFRSYFGDMEKL